MNLTNGDPWPTLTLDEIRAEMDRAAKRLGELREEHRAWCERNGYPVALADWTGEIRTSASVERGAVYLMGPAVFDALGWMFGLRPVVAPRPALYVHPETLAAYRYACAWPRPTVAELARWADDGGAVW